MAPKTNNKDSVKRRGKPKEKAKDTKSRKVVDVNAPSKWSSAYHIFYKEHFPGLHSQHPNKPMSVLSRDVSSAWAALSEEDRAAYVEASKKDRERFDQEMSAYKKTDKFKQFQKKRAAKLRKESKWKAEQELRMSREKIASKSTSNAVSQQWIQPTGWFVPVFTPEFLEHNRNRESTLKGLRRKASVLEEERALLSKHLDNMQQQIEAMDRHSEEMNTLRGILDRHYVQIVDRMVRCIKHLPLPDESIPEESRVVSSSNVLSFMERVSQYVSCKEHQEYTAKVQGNLARNLVFRNPTSSSAH